MNCVLVVPANIWPIQKDNKGSIEKAVKTCNALINCRSVVNKTQDIHMELTQNDLDVCVSTETWIKEDDNLTVHQICPNGYKASSVPRKDITGGGITVVYREIYQVKTLIQHAFVNMESAGFKVTIGNRSIVLTVIF